MANKNINLATFSFDNEKLLKNLTDLRSQMTILRNEINSTKKSANEIAKEFSATAAKMVELENAGEETSEEYQELSDKMDLLSKSLSVQNTLLETTESQLRLTQREYKETSNIVNALTNNQNELSNAQERTNQLLEKEIDSIASARASNKEILALRNQLNPALKEEADLITQLNQRLDSNNEFIKENASAYEQQKINIGNYSESIQDALSKIDPFNFSLSQFIQISQESGGSGSALVGVFDQLRNGIVGMTRAAVAFIATPIGAAITALAGVGLVAKEFFSYNSAIKESIMLTEQFTGLSGQAADNVRLQAQAISDTFGSDFEETLKVAQGLVNSFGITYEEALNTVQEGLESGGVANREFFDSLREYPTFFAQAGYSAKEFTDIVNAGFDLGIYNDKLPDAIKEAGLALTEQTKATSDAMANAFGTAFSDDILSRIRTGQTSVSDALEEISIKAEESQLNQQQLAQLTADLFKGAGEDAGGALKVFEAINLATNEQNKTLSETEIYYQKLADANLELAKAKDEALKSEGILEFQKNLELLWTQVQTVFYQTVGWLQRAAEWYNKTIETSKSLTVIWETVGSLASRIGVFVDNLKASFQLLAQSLGINNSESSEFLKALSYLFDPIKKLEIGITALSNLFDWWSGNIQSAITNLTALQRTATETFENIRNLDFAAALDISKSFENNKKAVEDERDLILLRNKALEGTKNMTSALNAEISKSSQVSKTAADNQIKDTKAVDKAKEDSYNAEIQRMREGIDLYLSEQGVKKKDLAEQLEIERRVAADSIKILDTELKNKKISREKYATEVNKINNNLALLEAQLMMQNAMDEIELFQQTNQKRIEDNKILTDELVSEEIERLNTLSQMRMEAELLNFTNGLTTQREYQAQTLAIQQETQEQITELNRQNEEQRRAEELERRALEFEEDLILMEEEGATRFEMEQAIRDEQYQLEVEKLNMQREQNLISEDLYQQQLSNIEKKWNLENRNAKEANEKAILETQIQYAQMSLSAMGEVIGKETAAGKALAIAQIGLNTAMAIMRAYSDLGPILGTVFAAIVGTVSAVQIGKVLKTKPPKVDTTIRGYADGGIINSGTPIKRSNGDDVLITAKRGEVILNESQQSRIGAHVLSYAGVPGFATGGVVGSSNSALVQNSVYNQMNQFDVSETITEAVRQGAMEGSREGSASGSQSGIKDLNTDLQIQRDSNF